ncbi:MAG: sigma factor [Micromonosporaceae bacterium]
MPGSTGFDQFYATTARRVAAQVAAMVGDLGEAEDAVSEAYARAWQRLLKLSRYTDPVAWVRTVAYRIAVSSWRRTRNRLLAQERGEATRVTMTVLVDRLGTTVPLCEQRYGPLPFTEFPTLNAPTFGPSQPSVITPPTGVTSPDETPPVGGATPS